MPTLVLSAQDVRNLLTIDECIAVVENAFRLHGEGKTGAPGLLGLHLKNGGFHIKAGTLDLGRNYFAAKVNGNFPGNRSLLGLPTIQGIIVLADGDNGVPLAVMDSMEITAQRTAAATAVAAKYLARKDSRVATICGCGVQGAYQLRALARVLALNHFFVSDLDGRRAVQFAEQLQWESGLEVQVRAFHEAVLESDVCVTCTTSRRYFLTRADVVRGTLIAAVGADNPEKQEIEPALMARSRIVCDVVEQCAAIGDLHHAIECSAVAKMDVYAELGEIVAGKKIGRTSNEELVIFDSTGMALQDVAAAALVYEKAVSARAGLSIEFAA